jgi:hypothetical protein
MALCSCKATGVVSRSCNAAGFALAPRSLPDRRTLRGGCLRPQGIQEHRRGTLRLQRRSCEAYDSWQATGPAVTLWYGDRDPVRRRSPGVHQSWEPNPGNRS